MVSKVTIGDIRGLLVDADKRPVLRLMPEMDEVCRGYTIAHLGDAETIASQAWMLNATDWIRGQKKISFNLCKILNSGGFNRELHQFALRIAEDLFNSHEKQGIKILKVTCELLERKRRWMEGEVSDKELNEARVVCLDAYGAVGWDVDWAVYGAVYSATDWSADWAAYGAADWAADWAADAAVVIKKQLEWLGELLEDAVGIERGFNGESLESKV